MAASISTEPHALPDRALHAQKADAELVFHQLANGAHTPVSEMIDIIDLAPTVLDLDQMLQHCENVFPAQNADRIVGIEAEP